MPKKSDMKPSESQAMEKSDTPTSPSQDVSVEPTKGSFDDYLNSLSVVAVQFTTDRVVFNRTVGSIAMTKGSPFVIKARKEGVYIGHPDFNYVEFYPMGSVARIRFGFDAAVLLPN